MSCYGEGNCDCAEHLKTLCDITQTEIDTPLGKAVFWAIDQATQGARFKSLLNRAGQKLSVMPFMEGVTEEQMEKTGINQLLEDIWKAVGTPVKENDEL
jgi:hypothetical protein